MGVPGKRAPLMNPVTRPAGVVLVGLGVLFACFEFQTRSQPILPGLCGCEFDFALDTRSVSALVLFDCRYGANLRYQLAVSLVVPRASGPPAATQLHPWAGGRAE